MSFQIVAKEEDIRDLYKRFTLSQGEYFLGKVPLEDPCDEIRLTLRGHQGNYSLDARISVMDGTNGDEVDSKKKKKSNTNGWIKIIEEALRTSFSVRRVKDTILFLNSEGNYDYVIRGHSRYSGGYGMMPLLSFFGDPFPERESRSSKSSASVELSISSGEDSEVSLVERPLNGPETFISELWQFFQILQTTVEAIYRHHNGGTIPDINLPLRPVKVRTEERASRRGGLFGLNDKNLEKAIEVQKPQVPFSDIGGLEEPKRQIQGLSFAVKNPALYQKWGTEPPKGVILWGPPGTGKTLLAKALATEVECSFYHVKVTDLLSVMHSESESHMEEVFDIAKENAPSIIFFDEIDAIAINREHAGSEISRRIVSILLENLDGLEENDGVIVVGSTNQLDAVDPALQRAGRFSRIIEVPRPDKEARRQIILIHIAKAEDRAKRKLFIDLDLSQLVEKTKDMSGADIAEIIRRALEEKLRQEGSTGLEPSLVTTEDLLKEITSYERIKETRASMGFGSHKDN